MGAGAQMMGAGIGAEIMPEYRDIDINEISSLFGGEFNLPGGAPSLNAPGFGMIVSSFGEVMDDLYGHFRPVSEFEHPFFINIAPPPGKTSGGGGGGSTGDPILDGLRNGNLTLNNGQINYTTKGGQVAELEQKRIRQKHRDQKVINAGNPEQAQANEAARIASGWANRTEQSAAEFDRNFWNAFWKGEGGYRVWRNWTIGIGAGAILLSLITGGIGLSMTSILLAGSSAPMVESTLLYAGIPAYSWLYTHVAGFATAETAFYLYMGSPLLKSFFKTMKEAYKNMWSTIERIREKQREREKEKYPGAFSVDEFFQSKRQ